MKKQQASSQKNILSEAIKSDEILHDCLADPAMFADRLGIASGSEAEQNAVFRSRPLAASLNILMLFLLVWKPYLLRRTLRLPSDPMEKTRGSIFFFTRMVPINFFLL